MDVWQYIKSEQLEIPSIYFTHQRDCIDRDGMILYASEFVALKAGEIITQRVVRYRTVGDMTCTGAVESIAASLDEIIDEIAASRTTERGTRSDDKRSETAMEDRKKAGYF